MYVAPKRVSGLVVNTVILDLILGISKITSAPTDLPIQFLCKSFTWSGQSKESRPSSNDSAYSVIRNIH